MITSTIKRKKLIQTSWCLLLPLTALATSPHLADLEPTGAQRGTEIELTFSGDRLQDTEEILCFEPGLEILKILSTTNKTVKARLKLSPDCALGEHHLRLRTATGLSDLRTFFVGPFPVLEEVEPNDEPAKAQKVPLNTTVAGVIRSEDVDCFAVELKQGQRLSAEVEGMRLGRGAFDPRLSVLAPDGSILADVADSWLGMQDPVVSLLAPRDGIYILRLRETTYAGSDTCHYRLHIGSFPRPTSIFPLSNRTNDTVSFKCFNEATNEFT